MQALRNLYTAIRTRGPAPPTSHDKFKSYTNKVLYTWDRFDQVINNANLNYVRKMWTINFKKDLKLSWNKDNEVPHFV